jgi:hypothetical protein
MVVGFEGSPWDLSDVDAGADEDELAVYLSLDELDDLRDLDLDRKARAVLAIAQLTPVGTASVVLTEEEATVILAAARAAADAARGAKRRRLDRSVGRIEGVFAALRMARAAAAH